MVDENPETPEVVTSPSDQRRNLRAPLITQKIRLDDGRKSFFGYTQNLSRSGMFVSTLKPLEPGSRVLVEFPLPAPLHGDVRCQCEVVWARTVQRNSPLEPGMGLRFLDLPQDLAAAIDAWTKDQS